MYQHLYAYCKGQKLGEEAWERGYACQADGVCDYGRYKQDGVCVYTMRIIG